MERLVLLIIAAIGLHTAFVLYMADVRPVDQKTATPRSGPAASASEVTAVRPTVDTEVPASIPPPIADGSTLITRDTDPRRSHTLRANAAARFEVRDRSRTRLSGVAKPDRVYALRGSPTSKGFKKVFGDHVVIYKTDMSRPARNVSVALQPIRDDDYAPKRKKNSLVAKLQLVYKKPWDLIKAVGSKLR